MQKLTDYRDYFQFYLHIPIAIFENMSDEELYLECADNLVIPIVIIRNSSHPLFSLLQKKFKSKIKIIILCVGYANPYLS
jgi:hypothetical protein